MKRILLLFTLFTLGATLPAQPDKEGFYKPVNKVVEGWTIEVEPVLLEAKNKSTADKAFTALANHLQRVKYILPAARVKELQTIRIRLELHNERMGAMQYHPSRQWLRANRHAPDLAKHVHIPRAKALFSPHMWAKHPYVIMHELAHAYHDQILGWNNKEIAAAYEDAKKSGIYDKVLLYTGRKNVKHYGMNNPKEYFAEATEAYLGVNDFYPFVRSELKEHDPRMFKIMEKIWGQVR